MPIGQASNWIALNFVIDSRITRETGSTIVGSYADATGSHGFIYDGSSYTTINDPLASVQQTFVQGISGSTLVGYYDDTAGVRVPGDVGDS